eukprot:jgi/Psemu1/36708/gm1.36708_g
MTYQERKRNKGGESATAASHPPPAAIALSDDENSSFSAGDRASRLDKNESGEFGVILVNNNYHRNEMNLHGGGGGAADGVRGMNDGFHRGTSSSGKRKGGNNNNNNSNSNSNNNKPHPTTFVDRLTQVCRALLVPEWLEQTELCCGATDVHSEATDGQLSVDNNNNNNNNNHNALDDDENASAVNRWSAHHMQREQDISLLTDVSLLTDASLMDLVLSDRDEESIAKEMMATAAATTTTTTTSTTTTTTTTPNKKHPLHNRSSRDLPVFRKNPPNTHERLVEQAVQELRQRREERERKEHLNPRLPHAVVNLEEEEESNDTTTTTTKKKKKKKKFKSGGGSSSKSSTNNTHPQQQDSSTEPSRRMPPRVSALCWECLQTEKAGENKTRQEKRGGDILRVSMPARHNRERIGCGGAVAGRSLIDCETGGIVRPNRPSFAWKTVNSGDGESRECGDHAIAIAIVYIYIEGESPSRTKKGRQAVRQASKRNAHKKMQAGPSSSAKRRTQAPGRGTEGGRV